jgi:hypothetical protein
MSQSIEPVHIELLDRNRLLPLAESVLVRFKDFHSETMRKRLKEQELSLKTTQEWVSSSLLSTSSEPGPDGGESNAEVDVSEVAGAADQAPDTGSSDGQDVTSTDAADDSLLDEGSDQVEIPSSEEDRGPTPISEDEADIGEREDAEEADTGEHEDADEGDIKGADPQAEEGIQSSVGEQQELPTLPSEEAGASAHAQASKAQEDQPAQNDDSSLQKELIETASFEAVPTEDQEMSQPRDEATMNVLEESMETSKADSEDDASDPNVEAPDAAPKRRRRRSRKGKRK